MTGTPPQLPPLIALTGASGFLGSHIASTLLDKGYRVRAAVRPQSDLWRLASLDLEIVISALGDPEALDGFLDGTTALIHCAGVIRSNTETGYELGNVHTTRFLLEAAQRSASIHTFILISSLAASGPNAPGRPVIPRTETDICRPITAYGRSKLQAEKMLSVDLPFRTAALRPPALYGPMDTAFLPLFKAAANSLSIKAGNIRALSLLDGRDCARAAVLLMENPKAQGPYFVEDGKSHTYQEMASALGSAFGHSVYPVPLPMFLLRITAGVVGCERASRLPLLSPDRLRDLGAFGWVCTAQRLREELGFGECRDLETGFRETLEYYRKSGLI